jgi:deoxyribodipyrimidine photolyase
MPDRIGYSAQLHADLINPIDFKGFSRKMSEREDEHFDIDDEFLGDAEESHDFDPIIERPERRPKAAAAAKRGTKAAWSRVEDVLAERQLEKELRDIFEED